MQSRIEAGPSQPQQRHRWPELLLHLAQDVREKRVVAKVHVAGLARHERQVRDLWDVVIGHKAPCAPPRGVVPRELAPSLRQGLEAEIALGRAEAELRKGVLVGERRGAAVPSTQGEVVREARRRRALELRDLPRLDEARELLAPREPVVRGQLAVVRGRNERLRPRLILLRPVVAVDVFLIVSITISGTAL